MRFYTILLNYLRTYTVPVAKSFYKAYKDTTHKFKSKDQNKKHPFEEYFGSMMARTNLTAPPITQQIALEILNINENIEEVEPRRILQRYYELYKKNDIKIGGTIYLQSKIYAAKECLMNRYENAEQLQNEFYEEVVKQQNKEQNEKNNEEIEEQKQRNNKQ